MGGIRSISGVGNKPIKIERWRIALRKLEKGNDTPPVKIFWHGYWFKLHTEVGRDTTMNDLLVVVGRLSVNARGRLRRTGVTQRCFVIASTRQLMGFGETRNRSSWKVFKRMVVLGGGGTTMDDALRLCTHERSTLLVPIVVIEENMRLHRGEKGEGGKFKFNVSH